MRPDEWQRSAFLSFGVRLDLYRDEDRDARVRLLKAVKIDGDCWISQKSTIQLGSKRIGVTRAAHALMIGPVPPDAEVATSCGNPRCVYHTMLAVKQSEKPTVSEAQ